MRGKKRDDHLAVREYSKNVSKNDTVEKKRLNMVIALRNSKNPAAEPEPGQLFCRIAGDNRQ